MIINKIAQYAISLITLLIAYLFTVTIAGCFRAWVAKKMGDSTAEDAGFLTLDPIVHSDFLGILLLTLFGVGWGQNIPVNPHNIHAPHRTLKMVCAFFSGVFIHLVLSSIALFSLSLIFESHTSLADASISSFTLSTGNIITSFILLNVFLAVVSLVINTVSFIVFQASEKYGTFPTYVHYIILFLPIIIFIVFSTQIQHGIMYIIMALSSVLAHLFGTHL